MTQPQADVTTLLTLAHQGDAIAQATLYRVVEAELRKRAHARLRHERGPHGLQTTVLVDDAFLKLVGGQNLSWENRTHFYCLAGRIMREILVSEARRRAAERRGGGAPPARLDAVAEPSDPRRTDPLQVLAVDEALTMLADRHPELRQIVELHHFGGWDLKEIAHEILHVPYITVKRRWERARTFLYRALSGNDKSGTGSTTTE